MSQALRQVYILSRFKISVIHPFYPDILTEHDFICFGFTDRNLLNDENLLPADFTSYQTSQAQLIFSANMEGRSSHEHVPSEPNSSGIFCEFFLS